MQPHQLAGQIQPESVTGDLFAVRAAGEALEDEGLHLQRNRPASVADRQVNPTILLAPGDLNATPWAVVLASVLEEILQNQRSVTPLARDQERGRNLGFDLELERVRQRVQIVQPLFDELAQVYGAELDPDVSRVHPGKEQEIVDHSREAIRLVMQRRKFVVHGRLEVFA